MHQLFVDGDCDVTVDDGGVLRTSCPVTVRQCDGVLWIGASGRARTGHAYAYMLDVAPGQVESVQLRGGAVLRLEGLAWLNASLSVLCDNSTLEFALPAPATLQRLTVVATGAGRITSRTRAFVRQLDARLAGNARIDAMYVADDAQVVSQDQLAGAHLHVHRGTRCAGNGVHVQDMAMHAAIVR